MMLKDALTKELSPGPWHLVDGDSTTGFLLLDHHTNTLYRVFESLDKAYARALVVEANNLKHTSYWEKNILLSCLRDTIQPDLEAELRYLYQIAPENALGFALIHNLVDFEQAAQQMVWELQESGIDPLADILSEDGERCTIDDLLAFKEPRQTYKLISTDQPMVELHGLSQ